MARYYLHLRDGIDELLDPDGQELADLDALARAVLESARDVMSGDIMAAGIVDCVAGSMPRMRRAASSIPWLSKLRC